MMRPEGAERNDEPMWYAADATTIHRAGGPLARRLLDACVARWGAGAPVVIDLQVVRLGEHNLTAPPEARPVFDRAWRGTGPGDEVALLVDGPHPVLTGGGEPLAHDGQPFFVPASLPVAGRALPPGARECFVVMALGRRAAPGEALNFPRTCARHFAPGNPPLPTGPLPEWANARTFQYHAGYRVLGRLPAFDHEVMAAEPAVIACEPRWLEANGGPIGRAFAAALPEDWRAPGADVIVIGGLNELSPGFWPTVTGWHMDGTSRIRKREDGTPDHENPGKLVEQIICCVGPAGMTGLLMGKVTLPVIPVHSPWQEGEVWRQRLILEAIERGEMAETRAIPYELVYFTFGDFHSGRPAREPGWRYFIKAMRGRGDPPVNQLGPGRRQVTWTLDTGTWPEDALGVFPTSLPPGLSPR
jgi:hypothetical protein